MKINCRTLSSVLSLAALCGCSTLDEGESRGPGGDEVTMDDGMEGVKTRTYEEGEENEAFGVEKKF